MHEYRLRPRRKYRAHFVRIFQLSTFTFQLTPRKRIAAILAQSSKFYHFAFFDDSIVFHFVFAPDNGDILFVV